MTIAELMWKYPNSSKFLTRMATVDPNYGSQLHQQQFVARMHRMQDLQPCPKDHEHNHECYKPETVARAQ